MGSLDFAVDVSNVYSRKLNALAAYESVFSGSQAELLDKYTTEDRYVGGLVGVRFAEAFKARSPLLVADPEVFGPSRFGGPTLSGVLTALLWRLWNRSRGNAETRKHPHWQRPPPQAP